MDEGSFGSPLHPSIHDLMLDPSWCKPAGICVAGAMQSTLAPRLPTALLCFPAFAGDTAHEEALPSRKYSYTVFKKAILSPQGQKGEETSMCLCHLSGKAFLLPLVCIY